MLRQDENGVVIEVRVKPNAKKFALYAKDGRLILEVTSPPQEGKANIEIIKGLKKLFGRDVKILSGFRGREKTVLIINAEKKEIEGKIRINNQQFNI